MTADSGRENPAEFGAECHERCRALCAMSSHRMLMRCFPLACDVRDSTARIACAPASDTGCATDGSASDSTAACRWRPFGTGRLPAGADRYTVACAKRRYRAAVFAWRRTGWPACSRRTASSKLCAPTHRCSNGGVRSFVLPDGCLRVATACAVLSSPVVF